MLIRTAHDSDGQVYGKSVRKERFVDLPSLRALASAPKSITLRRTARDRAVGEAPLYVLPPS